MAKPDPQEPESGPEREPAAERPELAQRLARLVLHRPRVERYVELREIARGGMGAIFAVRDEDLDRTVALKRLELPGGWRAALEAPRNSSLARALELFLDEARTMSRLDHPGILPVHEVGLDAQERLYFTMPLVQGQDLRTIFELARAGRENWNLTRAAAAVLKVCEALAFAHSRGVLHRDLKPSNVMVGRFGEVYVMDWGLAQVGAQLRGFAPPLPGGADGSSAAAGIVGTPGYMPPEQALGREQDIGVWSDIYSLGAILRELLSGATPYLEHGTLSPAEVLERTLREAPPALDAEALGVPRELLAISERAMRREIHERYASVEALAEDLRAWLDGRILPSGGSAPLASFGKWMSRNPIAALALEALVVVGAASALAVLLIKHEKTTEVRAATERAAESARSAELAGYASGLRAVQAEIEADNSAGARALLARSPSELNGLEWRLLSRMAEASLGPALEHPARPECVTSSPDGDWLATGARDGVLRLWRTRPQLELVREIPAHAAQIQELLWSASGRRIVSLGADRHLCVWSMPDGARLSQDLLVELPVASALDPRGELCALGMANGRVQLRTLDGTAQSREFQAHERALSALSFGAQGDLFSASALDAQVLQWSTASLELERGFDSGSSGVVDIDAAGGRLALLTRDHGLQLVALDSGVAPLSLPDENRVLARVVLDPTGRSVAAATSKGALLVWDTHSGEQLAHLLGHTERARDLCWSPDGTRLYSVGQDGLRAWDPGECQPRQFAQHGSWIEALAEDPQHQRLASAGWDTAVRLWDARDGSPLACFSLPDRVGALCFLGGGEQLAAGTSDGRIFVLDGSNGAVQAELLGHTGPVRALAEAGKGQLLSASADNSARLWSLDSNDCVRQYLGHGRDISALALRPGTREFATSSWDGSVRLWSLDDGRERANWAIDTRELGPLAFHPDGRRFAVACADGSIALWDAQAGAALSRLRAHEQRVGALAFSPDGSRLASAAWDRTLRLWELERGECLLRLHIDSGLVDWPTALLFSPDGESILFGARDGWLRRWSSSAASK